MTKNAPSPILVLLALIAVQVLFGVNYVVSKVVVDAFPPLAWASFRIIVSSIFMLGVCFISGTDSPRGLKQFFGPLVIFALLGIIINQASFLVGLHYTTSTNSAVLNTLIPIVTFLIVTVRGQERLTLRRAIGFTSAFAGVLILRKIEDFSLSNQTMIGDLLTILNCISYGFFLAYSKALFEQNSRLWTTTWLFIYGSFGLTALALPDWLHFQMPQLTPLLIGCMLFGIFGATIATYFLNFWALAYAKSSSVAIFIYLQPVVAALLAWAWHDEPITLRTTASSLLIFTGMVLVLFQSPKRSPAEASEV